MRGAPLQDGVTVLKHYRHALSVFLPNRTGTVPY